MSIPTPVLLLYTANKAQSRSGLKCDVIQKVTEVNYQVTSLGRFLHCAQYSPSDLLAYHQMVSGCSGGGALLSVQMSSIKLWYA